MPRGFLVKRNRRCLASYRPRNKNKVATCDNDKKHHEKADVTKPVNHVWCVPGTDVPLPLSREDSTEVWNLNVEAALEAEADRRAQLPDSEEHESDMDVLTPTCDFSCFFPPPPPHDSLLMEACSPVKPVRTRLPEQHEEGQRKTLFTETRLASSLDSELPFSASIERLFVGSSRQHAQSYGPGQNHDVRKHSIVPPEERLNRPNRPSAGSSCKKPKVNRKLTFEDEVTTSPVLGLRIKKECPEVRRQHRHKSSAPNGSHPLGEFICQLCKEEYADPLSLAQHRCSRIVRVEYRCPECDKVFSCPANLASHRRWHKPRPVNNTVGESCVKEFELDGKENELLCVNQRESSRVDGSSLAPPDSSPRFNQHLAAGRESPPPGLLLLNANPYRPSLPPAPPPFVQAVPEDEAYDCSYCGKKFRRQAYLKKHMVAAHEMTARASSPYEQNHQVCACHLCGARFPSAEIRDKHRVWHAMTGELLGGGLRADVYGGNRECREQQLLTCKYCTSTFLSSPGLTRHISKAHPGESLHVMMQMAVRN
ncbi:insulinoma-associated protein 2 [Dunckerocampus dactyliophorus]|uniref:insulinoma-associated protein 2 n=1 Tax=Dunckerocampus dactyliophorus TaxID=161453 RepID=UPI002406659E|nr:insulinoma-associated protein 2 [Dunckerocampus dactyliophorus]